MAHAAFSDGSPDVRDRVADYLRSCIDGQPEASKHRSDDDLEAHVEALTEDLLSRNRGDASTSGREHGSGLIKLKPKPNAINNYLDWQARQIKTQVLEACCFQDADLQQLWDLLQQHATYEAEPSINYDAFMQVGHRMEEVQPALARYFKPSVFMRFECDHRGMVPVQLLVNYLSARSYHLHLRLQLMQAGDAVACELDELQLRQFIMMQIPRVPALADIKDVEGYAQIAARKFMFFEARKGRLRFRDLLASQVWQEFSELKHYSPDDPSIGNNWFSQQSVARVVGTFHAWDVDCSGGLTLDEFSAINGAGTLSTLVLQRVFQEHVAKKREAGGLMADEMSLLEFVDFVLAWDCRANPATIPYFFAIFDLQKQGMITPADLYTFWKEIHTLWLARGELDIPISDVVDEIIDMVQPASPAGITVKDLQTSRMSHTLFSILADVQQFYEYNYRENSMHTNEDQ